MADCFFASAEPIKRNIGQWLLCLFLKFGFFCMNLTLEVPCNPFNIFHRKQFPITKKNLLQIHRIQFPVIIRFTRLPVLN